MPSKKGKPKDNILDMIPKRTRKWKRGEKVTIVVPKAQSIVGKHFIDAFRLKPTYRINLDDYGSAVWKLCDGTRTVKKIGDELKAKFGKRIEPVYERLAVFVGRLRSEGLIKFV